MFIYFRNISTLQSGVSENVVHFLSLVFGFVTNISIAFVYGWKLTLVVIYYIPLVFIGNVIISKVSKKPNIIYFE